jgi:hypothetical protein
MLGKTKIDLIHMNNSTNLQFIISKQLQPTSVTFAFIPLSSLGLMTGLTAEPVVSKQIDLAEIKSLYYQSKCFHLSKNFLF